MYSSITLVVCFIILAAVFSYVLWKQRRQILNLKTQLIDLQKSKERSVNTQRAVIKGQLAEQLYPLKIDCKYHYSDMKFMGMPIDFIVFNGYTDCKDGEGKIKEIVFVDIKDGNAQLNKVQRSIRDCVTAGAVRRETIHIKDTVHSNVE